MSKHPVRTAALAIAAALALSACGKSEDDGPAAQAAKDVQAIKDSEASFVAGFKAKDLEKVVAFYGSSAMVFFPGQTPTKGMDQIRYVYRLALGDPAAALTIAADRVEVAAAGDIAYSRGTFEQTATDATSHKPVTVKGDYVTVFKKTANGSWKAIEDIVSPTKPATGTVTPATPAPPPGGSDAAADAEALKAADAQLLAAFNAKDPARIAGVYTADATVMLPDAPVMNGAAAIQAGMAETLKDPAFTLTFTPDIAVVSQSGDLGYTRGSFTTAATDPATKQPVKSQGFYVTVWRRQADGGWKAVQDIASPGVFPATPAK
jgi:ketosteroid isomerase-like protein